MAVQRTEPIAKPAGGLRPLLQLLRALLALLRAWILPLLGVRKRKRTRPWQIRIERKTTAAALSDADANDLLQRHRDLQDCEQISGLAQSYRLPESDFFGDPHQVEKLMRSLIAQNPPWLFVGKTQAGEGLTGASVSREFLLREQITREWQNVTLYIPSDEWRDLPLSSLTLRPTKTVNEVWKARLMDQILPPEVMLDRHSRGEISIPDRERKHQRLEFETTQRKMEMVTRKPVPVPIEMTGDSGAESQFLYVLLDYSASMRGKSAVLAMAVISAVLRANLGDREARYIYRRFAVAGEMYPNLLLPPFQAKTLEEKDALLTEILKTNFNGEATHVNDALKSALQDIESLRNEERIDADVLLVTDGAAEIFGNTQELLEAHHVKLHTVMVTSQPNPSLEAISESFTALDI